VIFGSFGAASLLAFASPFARAFSGSPAWAFLYFTSAIAGIGYTVTLLLAHLRSVRDADEVIRTRLVILALMVGTVLGLTELLADMSVPVPRGGSLGTLASACVLSVVALRFRLLEDHLPKRALVYSVALGVLAVALYLAVFSFLRENIAVVVLCTVTVTAGLLLATQHAVQSLSRKRERLERLAILGRLSAQMAHDLKNPLAAMRGAVAYLREEVARGRGLSEQGEFLALLEEQVLRVNGVVDRYQRVGGLQACRETRAINDIVRSVVSLQHFAADGATRVCVQLGESLPECSLDPELVERAIENLLVNAYEAMPRGGTVTVSTESAQIAGGRQAVAVTVSDAGTGMDPRAAERAFDDFFTTKPHGTGLGLFLVKRVAEAHGGDVLLSSRPGLGTVARLSLPVT
jgi:signal transduction histidine kinase